MTAGRIKRKQLLVLGLCFILPCLLATGFTSAMRYGYHTYYHQQFPKDYKELSSEDVWFILRCCLIDYGVPTGLLGIGAALAVLRLRQDAGAGMSSE
ncbi:MAG TPA: hypothetical protein V6D17_07310 [Candidatus Obscuribacterales bacterium]